MPVAGPEYSKEKADQAVEEIKKLLLDRFKIRAFDIDKFNKTLDELRKEDDAKLKEVIHSMFMHDSWEGW